MKTSLLTTALCLAGSLSAGLFSASATFEVSAGIEIQSASDFYQPLAASGAWIQTGNFGRCWHPAVAAEWRPYCNGNWEWTDCGWYWVSDESWAWACYHYGTWAFDPTYGWVWIPGVEWAPAWVVWRTSDDYIGWAPCGPSGIAIEASAYVFVQSGDFSGHIRPDKLIVNNPGLVSRTSEGRSAGREQREVDGKLQTVMVNNGPDLGLVEKATGHKFTPVSVQKANQSTYRNAPEQLKRPATEPVEQPATPQPDLRGQQRPVEILPKTTKTPGANKDTPYNIQPGQEVPTERNQPGEKAFPQTLPERQVPQAPPQRVVPPGNNQLPGNGGERQREVVPPVQTPRQPVPAKPPGNGQQTAVQSVWQLKLDPLGYAIQSNQG